MRMLDLFCGRFGWSRAFAARGWECVGVDLVAPASIPPNCEFAQMNVLDLRDWPTVGLYFGHFDFVCASPPCEQFSVHGMKHFHRDPPFPTLGVKLFQHTQELCEGHVPHVIENVRAAQQFVGNAKHHCGPFYLWGSGVPPLMNQGIRKHMVMGESSLVNELKRNGDREAIKKYRRQFDLTWNSSKSPERKEATAKAATIPPELANCVRDYAERLLEQRGVTK